MSDTERLTHQLRALAEGRAALSGFEALVALLVDKGSITAVEAERLTARTDEELRQFVEDLALELRRDTN